MAMRHTEKKKNFFFALFHFELWTPPSSTSPSLLFLGRDCHLVFKLRASFCPFEAEKKKRENKKESGINLKLGPFYLAFAEKKRITFFAYNEV